MRSPVFPICALLVLLVTRFVASEPLGPDCRTEAWVDADAGALRRYDGLRLGLERARLPRVCRVDLQPGQEAERIAEHGRALAQGARDAPLFLIGERAVSSALSARGSGESTALLYALVRYSAGGALLEPLPREPACTGVHAEMDAAHVGRVLRQITPGRRPRVVFAPGISQEVAERFARAAAIDIEVTAGPVDAVLHLRLMQGAPVLLFQEALARAAARRAVLISDERTRFGHGAGILLLPDEELVGRQAADMARLWQAAPSAMPAPRALPTLEVWVDLEALDRQGLSLPLPFLARADRLRRGVAPASAPR